MIAEFAKKINDILVYVVIIMNNVANFLTCSSFAVFLIICICNEIITRLSGVEKNE